MLSVAYVGMDVHKDTIRLAVLPETGPDFVEERTLPTDPTRVRGYLRTLSERYTLSCTYEASSCGYRVHRWLTQEGIACQVVAPSKVPRAAGDRVKTDRRDARLLAQEAKAGRLTAIRVPTEAEEAVRSLVRQYAAQRGMERAIKQRIQAFLLMQGQGYLAGEPWTQAHRRWLKALRFADLAAEVFQEYLAELVDLEARVAASARRLQTLAQTPAYRSTVGRLCCFRGITPVRAMVLQAAVIDFRRFAAAPQLMDYFGVVSREDSSGPHRQQGGITKAGPAQARYELVEAAWSYQHPPRVGKQLQARQAGQPPEVVAIAHTAQRRLHRKYWRLIHARKPSGVAAVAVARELAGFLWAAMQVEA